MLLPNSQIKAILTQGKKKLEAFDMRISVAKNHHFQNSLGLARLQTFVQNLTLTHSNITPGLYSL